MKIRMSAVGVFVLVLSVSQIGGCSDGRDPVGPQSYDIRIDFVVDRGHAAAPFSMAPTGAEVDLRDRDGRQVVRSAGILLGTGPDTVRVTASIAGESPRSLSGHVKLTPGGGHPWTWTGEGLVVSPANPTVTVSAVFFPGLLADQAVQTLTLPDTIQLRGGDTTSIDIEISPSVQGANPVMVTTPTGVVSVLPDRRLIGLQPGTSVLYAAAGAGLDSAIVVVESAQPDAIDISPDSVLMTALGETVQLAAEGHDAAGNPVGTDLTWSTQNPAVATVDGHGLVTATGNGSTLVIASDAGGASDTATVVVTQAVASVQVTPAELTLTALGDTASLTALARDGNQHPVGDAVLTWTSLDPEIVGVDAAGRVTAQGIGAAGIVASHGAGIADTAQVTVRQTVATVSITSTPGTLVSLGDTVHLTARAQDGNDQIVPDAAFTWTSTNSAVASVDPAGIVTAVGNGDASIVARHDDGPADTVAIHVSQVVSQLTMDPQSATFATIGATRTFAADARDAGGSPVDAPVSWTSLDPAIASVDQTGLVTSQANGTTSIIAMAGNVADTASVTVDHVPPSGLIPLQDDWMSTTRNPARWNDGLVLRANNPDAVKTQGNGELRLWADSTATELGGYSSVQKFDFTDKSVFIERRVPRSWMAEFQFVAGYGTGNANFVRVGLWGSDLVFFQRRTDLGEVVGVEPIPHDPVNHRFIRFGHRSEDDRLVLWMSPTGTEGSWLEVASLPRGPLNVTSMRVELQIKYHGADEPVVLGGLNVITSPTPD